MFQSQEAKMKTSFSQQKQAQTVVQQKARDVGSNHSLQVVEHMVQDTWGKKGQHQLHTKASHKSHSKHGG